MRLWLVGGPPQTQLTLEVAPRAEMPHSSMFQTLFQTRSGLMLETPANSMWRLWEISRLSSHEARFLVDVAVTRAVSTCCGVRRDSAG